MVAPSCLASLLSDFIARALKSHSSFASGALRLRASEARLKGKKLSLIAAAAAAAPALNLCALVVT